MATIKSTFKRFNGTGFDIHYFETSADLINETTSFKVLSAEERSRIELFLLGHTPDTSQGAGPFDTIPKGENDPIFNAANKLVQLDANGEIPIGLIPGGLDYLDTNNPTFTGTLTGSTINSTAGSNLIIDRKGTGNEYTVGAGIELREDKIQFKLSGTQDVFEFKDGGQAGGIVDLLGTNALTGLIAPVANSDAATKAYVDAVAAEGVQPINPVKAATTGNITLLTGTQTVDGIELAVDDRVLVKNQNTASENGIYLVKGDAWVKVTADSINAALVFVEEGTVNNDSKFYATDATTWILFSRVDTIEPGAGLTKTGTTLSIEDNAITSGMIAGTIDQGKIAVFQVSRAATPSTLWGQSANLSIAGHISQAASFLYRLRGDSATNLNDTLPITLADAALKNRTFVESSNPSTTGKVAGDLVFQTIT